MEESKDGYQYPSDKSEIAAKTRVAAGAALMDKDAPGWWERTDLTRLKTNYFQSDPAGQEFGSLHTAPWAWAKGLLKSDEIEYAAIEHGFWADSIVSYNDLDATWKELIQARRRGETNDSKNPGEGSADANAPTNS